MGRAPCCDKANVKRGPWSPEEDAVLRSYVERQGTGGNWIALPKKAGLKRCGKSCRLRWLNYLRPDIKHGGFTEEEDNTIYNLYKTIGSRWSVIASKLPGRTDNDVKNYWNTKLKKRLMASQNITPIPTPTTYIHPNTSPAPSPPILPPIMPAIISGATGSIEGDEGLLPGFGCTMDAQRLLFWELAQFPPLGLLEPSSASSSTTMENSSNSSYANPCFTGAGAEDWFLPELGFGSGEFIAGYGYEEKMGEVVDPYYPSILPNMWETTEAKPQGLCHQGVIYS